MPLLRRSFLIGAGGLITAAFVREAKTFAADTGKPLLLAPPRPKVELYYEWVEAEPGGDLRALLHLGPPNTTPPPPPLWIEHLRESGEVLDTPADIEAWCASSGMTPESLFEPLDEASWGGFWETSRSPTAMAWSYLQTPGLLPQTRGLERTGQLAFLENFWMDQWVEARDALSLSLLQARLNEVEAGVILRAVE